MSVARYGVKEQRSSHNACDRAIEQLGLLGFAVLDGGYSSDEMTSFSDAFERARRAAQELHERRKGPTLEELGEHQTIRLPMFYERIFLDLATHSTVLELCRRVMGEFIVLNQQNGLINPPGATYSQGAYHRDLPHQHFVSSRPLAISALFCLDEFTSENGATLVVPGSHKQEMFPSDEVIAAIQTELAVPAGSFIVLDSMVFHSGGVNRTTRERRAVNQVFSTPIIKPQIDLPGALGESFTADADLRKLLGYQTRVPTGLDEFYESRSARRR
jgi:ectoine hydroxylase-related dioxygenase (phytanoyl-CoA dioxygenase family)